MKAAPSLPGGFVFKGYEHPVNGTISDLAVFMGTDGGIYSVWNMGWRERLRLIFGAPVVIGVLMRSQPPMTVQVGEEMIPGFEEAAR